MFIFRTIEDLYEELVREGILIRCPKFPLKDYIGEYSYLGTTLRQANIEPMPSLSDVRQLVALYGIIPLGKSYISNFTRLLLSTRVQKEALKECVFQPYGVNVFLKKGVFFSILRLILGVPHNKMLETLIQNAILCFLSTMTIKIR